MSHRAKRLLTAATLAAVAAGAGAAWAQGKTSRILMASDGDVVKSIGDLTQAVARKPGDATAWRDLGIAQCRLGRYVEASEALARAAQGLDDDFYLGIYRAVTAEMRQEYATAADLFDQASRADTKASEALALRAAHLRARSLMMPVDPGGPFAAGPTTLALLPPVDLGGDAAELAPLLGSVLALALEQAEVDVLAPADTERWLAADGRSAADFDDPGNRDRVARNLARKGIEAVLACTFLHLPSGELHFRFALIRVSEKGAAETEAIPVEVGSKGQELVPLRTSVPALWASLGVTATNLELPASLAAARPFRDGLQQLRDGQAKRASASFCEARRLSPDVQRFGELCEQMAQLQADEDDPLAVSFDRPVALVNELVRELAQRQQRADRRFDDL